MQAAIRNQALLASAFLLLSRSALSQTAVESEGKTARLEGRIISLTDGKPLTGALVRLRRVAEGFGPIDPNDAAYTTQSSVGGAYAFETVEPGSYRIYADQPGYFRRFYGARSSKAVSPGAMVQVSAGQRLKNMDVELGPQGSISGRVRNITDEPVAEAYTVALQVFYENGHRELLPLASTYTDSEGGFRLTLLPPGKYYVRVQQKATPRIAGANVAGQRDLLTSAFQPTYYPGAGSVENAIPAVVTLGADIRGIDLRVEPAKLLRIEGEAKWDASGPPERPLVLALMPAGFDLLGTVSPRLAIVHKDGAFAFDEVAPGAYFIEPARVIVDPAGYRHISGNTEVRADKENLSHVRFQVVRAPDLTGRIQIEGGLPDERPPALAAGAVPAQGNVPPAGAKTAIAAAPPPPPPGYSRAAAPPVAPKDTGKASPPASPEQSPSPAIVPESQPPSSRSPLAQIGVRLVAADRISLNLPKAVSALDGTFELKSIPTGRYFVEVSNLPEGLYLKSISFGGQDVTTLALDLTLGFGGKLTVLLAKDAATVSGTARDEKDRPLSDVWVSLWRTDNGGAPNAEATMTDSRGAFRFMHLAPGEYKVAAWEETERGLAQAAAFCRLFDSDGAPVRLAVHAQETIDVKAISEARIEEAKWKLP